MEGLLAKNKTKQRLQRTDTSKESDQMVIQIRNHHRSGQTTK